MNSKPKPQAMVSPYIKNMYFFISFFIAFTFVYVLLLSKILRYNFIVTLYV